MKKIKNLLLILLLAPSLTFGQATGKVITNKPSGGSIGSAATTVDVVSLFNVNQTTAGQTLTVPNLTTATAGKTIHVNNVGSVSFTLTPGGVIPVGYGVILRWDGTQWSVSGVGNSGSSAGLPTVLANDPSVNGLRIESNSGNSYWDISTGNAEFNDAAVGRWYLYTPANGRSFTMEWDGKTSTAVGQFAIDSVDCLMQHSKQDLFNAPRYTFQTATANRVPFLNYQKDLAYSIVDSAELSYLDGATSNLQTQINTLSGATGTVTSIATTSPITGGTITTTGTIGIDNAAADGSTKGAASFTANDFDASSGNISIDYTNGQAASGSVNGFVNTTTQTFAGAKTFTGIPNFQTTTASNVPFINYQKNLVASVVDSAEFSRLNGVTSNVQNQLDTLTAHALGYTIVATHAAFNPSDGVTYWFGAFPTLSPVVAGYADSAKRIFPPARSKLVKADIHIVNATTDGSNESATIYVSKNNTTDATLSSSVKYGASTVAGLTIRVTGLNIKFNGTTDFFVSKLVCPTWGTNPQGAITWIQYYFEHY